MGVEDLLQKHALLEAAVAAQNERMTAVNQKADDYYSRILEQSGKRLTVWKLQEVHFFWSPHYLPIYPRNIKLRFY